LVEKLKEQRNGRLRLQPTWSPGRYSALLAVTVFVTGYFHQVPHIARMGEHPVECT
jgi:hypothetical protein